MNTSATLEQLKELKLQGMSRSYEAVLQLPVNQHPEGHSLIAQLAEAERQSRTQYKSKHPVNYILIGSNSCSLLTG